ncbi:MAG: hypothetical protein AABM32_05060 [Chloroflexota bacterium]
MMKLLALFTLVFAISCGTVGTASPSASPSTAPTASASPSASAIALAGSTLSMAAEREMVSFHADRGALIASSTKDSPPPYDSKIWRADPPGGPWRTIYASDAMFLVDRVSAGRIGFIEYREQYQGGGAYSNIFVVLDLTTGRKTEIDRFALTAATYHGGGGGPRRPTGTMALGPDFVAWTRLVEGPGGTMTGELRVAPVADPAASQLVARSAEWLRPLAIDAHRLVYVLGGTTADTLHVRDVESGTDKVIATGPVGNTSLGAVPGWDFAAVSGDWLVWLENAKAPTTTAHAMSLVSGDQRTVDVGGSGCVGPSAGTRYFTWTCSKQSASDPQPLTILDAKTLDLVKPIPLGTGVGTIAMDDGLLWFNVVGSGRTVTFFRPN